MKIEEWLAVLGFFAVIAVMVLAILPENLWQTQRLETKQVSATALVGLVPRGVPGGSVPAQAQSVTVAARRPAMTAAQQRRAIQPKPGLMPFEQAARVRFSGTIQQISELQQQDGQIHIWLNDPQGKEQHLSVAPSWFLHYMGCNLVHDGHISGVGFRFDKTRDRASVYVKKLVIGKTVCHLRNDEGFALWSNQLR